MRAKALVAVLVAAAALIGPLNPTSVSAHPTYTVKAGETLDDIATRLGMSTTRLAELNGISDPNLIFENQILITSEPERYTVRLGDVLGVIAERVGVPQARLVALNGLRNVDEIYEGQALIISGPTTSQRGGGSAAAFICPVRGGGLNFVNDYGYVRPDGSVHVGLDLFAASGTPVVAPVPGRVVRYPNPMGGLAFQLYGDDGVRYYGAHLSGYGAEGRVSAGAVIGYVGNSGDARTTSAHLHLEMHPGGGADTVSPYPSVLHSC